MIHGVRRLVKRVKAETQIGNPAQIAFGVVTAGGTGQVQVQINGSTTSVPAFNPTHTASVAAGTVVMVAVTPKRLYVMAAYP